MSTTPDSLQQNRTSADEGTVVVASTWGERLLPYLFAAMETCWIDAIIVGIASLSFVPNHFLVPLWSPFVFIAGTYWFMVRRAQQPQQATEGQTSSSNNIFVIAFLVVGVLLTLWSALYAPAFLFFDPRWLGALINDLLLLNGNAFHMLFILLVIAYFGWRGIRLSQNPLEPGSVANTLKIGLGIFLAIILFRALSGSQANELVLLLLVPLFLAFTLIAHSLAQATLLRRSHPEGLQGSTSAQENSLVSILSLIGVALLLVALVIGAVANPAFLTQVERFLSPVGIAYDWLAHGIAYVVTLIVTPFFWLAQALHLHPTLPQVKAPKPPPSPNGTVNPNTTESNPLLSIVAVGVQIMLLALIVFVIILAARTFLRRRRMRLARRQEDLHESLWSWDLFWTQVRTLLAHLFGRFFPKRSNTSQDMLSEELTGEPAARSIREIYRALLRWSASRGVARKRAETPYEFRARLDQHLPLAEPELRIVTEAYTATRYGRAVPSDDEVARVREAWSRIQQSQVQ